MTKMTNCQKINTKTTDFIFFSEQQNTISSVRQFENFVKSGFFGREKQGFLTKKRDFHQNSIFEQKNHGKQTN